MSVFQQSGLLLPVLFLPSFLFWSWSGSCSAPFSAHSYLSPRKEVSRLHAFPPPHTTSLAFVRLHSFRCTRFTFSRYLTPSTLPRTSQPRCSICFLLPLNFSPHPSPPLCLCYNEVIVSDNAGRRFRFCRSRTPSQAPKEKLQMGL